MKFALLLLTAALLLSSCAAPVVRRIEKNPQIYGKLSAEDKALVQRGQIREGMGQDAVFLAWGRADRVSAGSRDGKTHERWSYAGYEPVYGTTGGFGYSSGGYRGRHGGTFYEPFFYSEPSVTYLPYEARWVEFTNGRVSAWSSAR